MRTIVITDSLESPGIVHIPHPSANAPASTLCGWVDVGLEYHDHEDKPVNCKTCIDTFRAVRRLKAPRGYIVRQSRLAPGEQAAIKEGE